jgi:hypothetical protein
VRLARDMGTVRELFPEGVGHLLDLPYVLFDAIQRALMILGWHENLLEEEQPPRRIWADNERLNEWFADVKRKRKQEADDTSRGLNRKIDDPVQNQGALELIPVG